MDIDYATGEDYGWIKKRDGHVTPEVLIDKIDNRQILVGRFEGQLTGFLRFNYFWDSIPFMNLLWVEDLHRKKGFGGCLLRFWEKEMRLMGHSSVLTSTMSSEGAQHFYRKMGYVENGCLKIDDEPLEMFFIKKI